MATHYNKIVEDLGNIVPAIEYYEKQLEEEMIIDTALIEKILALDGSTIIKAAGNMAYPLGLRTENLAKEILFIAKSKGIHFEIVAGAGADRTNTALRRGAARPCR